MRRWLIIIVQLIVIQSITTAQITIDGLPVSHNNELKNNIPVFEIENISHEINFINDKTPLQAGYTLPINIKLSEEGV